MGRHQYLNEDEYEVNLKDFESQPGKLLDNLTIVWLAEVALPVIAMCSCLTQDAERVCSFYMTYIRCCD